MPPTRPAAQCNPGITASVQKCTAKPRVSTAKHASSSTANAQANMSCQDSGAEHQLHQWRKQSLKLSSFKADGMLDRCLAVNAEGSRHESLSICNPMQSIAKHTTVACWPQCCDLLRHVQQGLMSGAATIIWQTAAPQWQLY